MSKSKVAAAAADTATTASAPATSASTEEQRDEEYRRGQFGAMRQRARELDDGISKFACEDLTPREWAHVLDARYAVKYAEETKAGNDASVANGYLRKALDVLTDAALARAYVTAASVATASAAADAAATAAAAASVTTTLADEGMSRAAARVVGELQYVLHHLRRAMHQGVRTYEYAATRGPGGLLRTLGQVSRADVAAQIHYGLCSCGKK